MLPPVLTVLLLRACAAAHSTPPLEWQEQLYVQLSVGYEAHPSNTLKTSRTDNQTNDNDLQGRKDSVNVPAHEAASEGSSSGTSSSIRFSRPQLISILSSLAGLGLQPPAAVLQSAYSNITSQSLQEPQALPAKYVLRYLNAVARFPGTGCRPSPAALAAILESSALLHSSQQSAGLGDGSALDWLEVMEAIPMAISTGRQPLQRQVLDRLTQALLPSLLHNDHHPHADSEASKPSSSSSSSSSSAGSSPSSDSSQVGLPVLPLEGHQRLVGALHRLNHMPAPAVVHRLALAIHQQLQPPASFHTALATLTAISQLLDLGQAGIAVHAQAPTNTPSSAAGNTPLQFLGPSTPTESLRKEPPPPAAAAAAAADFAAADLATGRSNTLSLSDFVFAPSPTTTPPQPPPAATESNPPPGSDSTETSPSPVSFLPAQQTTSTSVPRSTSHTSSAQQADATGRLGASEPPSAHSPAPAPPSISCLASRLYGHLTRTTLPPLLPLLTPQQLVSLVSATTAVALRLTQPEPLPASWDPAPSWADAVHDTMFRLLPLWHDSDALVDVLRDLNQTHSLPDELRLNRALGTALATARSLPALGSATVRSGVGSGDGTGSGDGDGDGQVSSIILCLYAAASLGCPLQPGAGQPPERRGCRRRPGALQLHLPALQPQQLSFSLAALQRMGARLPPQMVDECLAAMAAVMRAERANVPAAAVTDLAEGSSASSASSLPAGREGISGCSPGSSALPPSSQNARAPDDTQTPRPSTSSPTPSSPTRMPSFGSSVTSMASTDAPGSTNAAGSNWIMPGSETTALTPAAASLSSGSSGSSSCSSADVALMAVTVARLQHVAGYSWSDAVSEHMVAHMQRYTGAELISVAWAFAKTHDQPSAEWVSAFYAATEQRLQTMAADNLATLLWAVAELELAPSEQWLTALISASQPQLGSFAPQSLVSVLDACAKLKFQPSPDWMCESLVVLQAYAPMLDLLAVSTVLSALVELGVRLTNLGWFSAFCQSVEPKLAASSLDQVLSICQSLTTLGYLPGPGWHAALVASARASPQQLTAGGLEQLLLCSAAMQAQLPDELLQASLASSPPQDWLVAFAQCARSHLGSFTTLELNTLTKALNTLNGKQLTPLAPLSDLLAYLKEWFIY
ncbi:MAG: hypothetical protein WDW36_001573 [Sanguina aurantia]